jgi:phage shock protein A
MSQNQTSTSQAQQSEIDRLRMELERWQSDAAHALEQFQDRASQGGFTYAMKWNGERLVKDEARSAFANELLTAMDRLRGLPDEFQQLRTWIEEQVADLTTELVRGSFQHRSTCQLSNAAAEFQAAAKGEIVQRLQAWIKTASKASA